MAGASAEAEIRTGSARVHVYTYHYERQAMQTRSPAHDVLALLAGDRATNSAGIFKTRAGVSRRLPIGDLVFVPAGTSICASGEGGVRRIVSCTGADGLLPRNFDRSDERYVMRCADIRDARLAFAMRRLGQEAVEPGFGSDILVDALISALRIDLARYFTTATAPARPTSGGLSSAKLRRVEEYVRACEHERIHVADLAALAGLSRGHFMRAFKQSTGKTVHQFVEETRLARACALLGQSDLPLKQIADRLGFATPSSFSLAFRRATAMTPAQFRRTASSRTM